MVDVLSQWLHALRVFSTSDGRVLREMHLIKIQHVKFVGYGLTFGNLFLVQV
jgi:hypothetical protein